MSSGTKRMWRAARARLLGGSRSVARASRKGTVAQTIGRVVCRTRPTALSFFCRCVKNDIDSTITAVAPRQAAASVTTAAKQKAQTEVADAATAATATAASTATAATSATSAATAAAANAKSPATAAAANVTSAATANVASAATATAMTSTAAAPRQVREARSAAFPVEEEECGKTHVSHFLFAENEALIGCGVERLRNVSGRKSGCRCASHQRKTQSGGTQCRYTSGLGGSGQALPLRSLLHPGHVHILHASVQFPTGKFYPCLMRRESWNKFTNSLLRIWFPFMLINGAPLRHDHDRIQSGRTHIAVHCGMGAVGAV